MTVRTLFLMRHAEAESYGGLGDRKRQLTAHGRREAADRAAAVAGVSHVLVSDATRTMQTVACLGLDAAVEPSRALYGADAGTILDAIREVDDSVPSLLVVGHNPGIHGLVLRLADTTSEPSAVRLASHFPTATLCRFEVEGDWVDLVQVRLTDTYRTTLPA